MPPPRLLLLRPARALFTHQPPRITATASSLTRITAVTLSSTLTTWPHLGLLQRSYSSQSRAEDELKRLAKEAAWSRKDDKKPVNMLIYHAGTGRTTFLALIKVTSLLVGAFFLLLVGPAYAVRGQPPLETAQMLVLGLTPAVFVALTTAPFVTHIHLRVPRGVSTHRIALERFMAGRVGVGKETGVGALSDDTVVTVTTMSLIAKPRQSIMPLGQFVSERQRMGLVNYVRRQPAVEAARDAEARKWYHWRPVTRFYVQDGRPGQPRRVRYQEPKADRVEWWIWEAVQKRLRKVDGK